MNIIPKTWFRQVTTAQGIMILSSTVLALASGGLDWAVALPLMAAGAIGVAWPEGAPDRDAAALRPIDVTAVLAAYRLGQDHVAPASGPVSPMPQPPTPADPVSSARGVAALAVAGLSLGGCLAPATPTPRAVIDAAAMLGEIGLARLHPGTFFDG